MHDNTSFYKVVTKELNRNKKKVQKKYRYKTIMKKSQKMTIHKNKTTKTNKKPEKSLAWWCAHL